MTLKKYLLLLGVVFSITTSFASNRPDCLYEEWRKSPYPSMGMIAPTNPTALLWRSEKYWEKKDVRYNVYLSQDISFSEKNTIKSLNQRYCFFNPHQKLKTGKWYWKYEIIEGDKIITKGTYNFDVTPGLNGIITPTAEQFIQNIPISHPRVMNYGQSMEMIREKAPSHPLYHSIIRRAKKIAVMQPYAGSVVDENPARQRKLNQLGTKEVQAYHSLIEGYILSGNEQMYDALMKRTAILLTWPTNDLLGSKVLNALATGYDVLYDLLSDDIKKQIEEIVDNQLKAGLRRWPGFTESRHVDNHFWQMELAGNFSAAVVMLHHLKSAREMLNYTYELFIARFPNLATQDGGWAEGEGYYSVNKTAVVDMALLIKKLGKVDLFQMEWYKNLTDYFTYFSPIAAPVSGFGDMHERVASGSLKGQSEMLVMGCEENNPYAIQRLFNSLKPVHSFYDGQPVDKDYWKKPLSEIEPWYQIVNNIRLDEKKLDSTQLTAKDKVFYGVGIAAMHTTVLQPQTDETVYFRSSPFGAKGHMHANQNAFNVSRKGERIFYSTGYYTSFNDLHSLTSYRHTRAHNTILVDGMGQAFGHEGYGAVLRHLEGKNISYVCGDASNAYHKVEDLQFKGFLEKHHITEGFGEPCVKKYKRHLFFVRPGVVIIYDELEAEKPVEWSLLLHTMGISEQINNRSFEVKTSRSVASATVFGSVDIKGTYTNEFYSPVVDFKKKYPEGTPLANHFSYVNTQKVDKMRYLTIICMDDEVRSLPKVKAGKGNKWIIGDLQVVAEMDADKPAKLVLQTQTEKVEVEEDHAVLFSNGTKQVCTDVLPKGNIAVNTPTVQVVVANKSEEVRTGEMIELSWNEITKSLGLTKEQSFVIWDEKGNEIAYQLTYDGKLIFPVNVTGHASAKFYIRKGVPQKALTYACGNLYPRRFEDLAWENDLVGFRAYGPALQRKGEKGFGYDLFAKRGTKEPVLPKMYALETDVETRAKIKEIQKFDPQKAKEMHMALSYHIDKGYGMDCYAVGPTLGAGVAALVDSNKIVYPWCFEKYEILDNGPLRFTVKLEFNPLEIEGQPVIETRYITLDAGSHFNKTKVSYRNLPHKFPIVTGIVLHDVDGRIKCDTEYGYFTYEDPTTGPNNGKLYLGHVFPKKTKDMRVSYFSAEESAVRNNAKGHVLSESVVNPNSSFEYYWGFGWNRSDIKNFDAWNTYVESFSKRIQSPLQIQILK